MRVALTVWENRISPVADSSRNLLVADIENRAIEGRHYEVFNEESVLYRARKLADLEVEVFICGAISDFYAILVEGYLGKLAKARLREAGNSRKVATKRYHGRF